MKRKWTMALLFTLLLGSLALSACGSSTSSQPSGDAGKDGAKQDFTYAMSGVYKPFNFKENGELMGFDVEIGKALAEKMGMNPVPITNPFETIIQGLQAKKYDTVIGSLTITPEREKAVAFSNVYYRSGAQIFVAADNDTIKSAEDLKGKKIGVQKASSYEQQALKLTDKSNITTFDSDVTALMDISTGRLDAVITDQMVGFRYMKEVPGKIKDVGEPLSKDNQAIALRKDDKELLEKVNKALDEIIKDGTYQKISEKWFGRDILGSE